MPKFYTEIPSLIQALRKVASMKRAMIAIDGRPCAGKSDLAKKMECALGAQCVYLDEFVLPQSRWPRDITPSFPFPYMRYAEFVEGIQTLAQGAAFSYFPFDWESGELSKKARVIESSGVILVEGVSTLNPVLLKCFDKAIFVVGEPQTEITALALREGGSLPPAWTELYLPSVDIYFRTRPWERAEMILAGRGVSSQRVMKSILAH
jgi:hypothetical protein